MSDKGHTPALVVFLDCLAVHEAFDCDWIAPRMKGRIDSGIPRVTPYVVSGILTGKKPPHHGILCPTQLDGPNLERPQCDTLIEEVAETKRVINYEMPFTNGLRARYLTNVDEQTRPPAFQIPRPIGSPWKDDIEQVFQAHVDYVRSVFATTRNVMRYANCDVVFLCIRDIDTFGHFYYKDQRARLIDYIDFEMEDTAKMGDLPILFFSDHGITDKTHAFYLNKWLIEQGWLDVEVWMPGVKRMQKGDDDPMELIGPHSPMVDIKESSYFVSPDAYDSGIKILRDDAPVDELIAALMETGMYAGIYRPEELYGDGPYLGKLGCDLVCDRADGVLVSGNLHPNLTSWLDADNYCQCNVRTGVHDRFGVWGTNVDGFDVQNYHPHEFYHVVKRFIDECAPDMPDQQRGVAESEDANDAVMARLADLGYV